MNTPMDSIRLAVDYGQLGRAVVGFNNYACYVINIANDQINFDALPGGQTITRNRITVADGYLSFAPGDGYLNPPVRQLDGQQLVLSGGSLTDNMLIVGPFVFPYEVLTVSGGTDPSVFQLAANNNQNNQVYVNLLGPGLNEGLGNFFEVDKINIREMNNISYDVILKAIPVPGIFT